MTTETLERPLRLTGHRLEMDRTGSQGLAFKPRCSCGWVGRATFQTAARGQYDNHKRAIVKAATNQ